jgi:hypothetical protein
MVRQVVARGGLRGRRAAGAARAAGRSALQFWTSRVPAPPVCLRFTEQVRNQAELSARHARHARHARGGRTHDSAAVAREVAHVGRDAGGVHPGAARERGAGQADERPVRRRRAPARREPQAAVAARHGGQAGRQCHPAPAAAAQHLPTRSATSWRYRRDSARVWCAASVQKTRGGPIARVGQAGAGGRRGTWAPGAATATARRRRRRASTAAPATPRAATRRLVSAAPARGGRVSCALRCRPSRRPHQALLPAVLDSCHGLAVSCHTTITPASLNNTVWPGSRRPRAGTELSAPQKQPAQVAQ